MERPSWKVSDSADWGVTPLPESLRRQRVKTDWLNEQVSTRRRSAKCTRVAEETPVGKKTGMRGCESLGSLVCQYRFTALNLIHSSWQPQVDCKEQFGDVEGETGFSFLEWLEGQRGWGWERKEEVVDFSVKNWKMSFTSETGRICKV